MIVLLDFLLPHNPLFTKLPWQYHFSFIELHNFNKCIDHRFLYVCCDLKSNTLVESSTLTFQRAPPENRGGFAVL